MPRHITVFDPNAPKQCTRCYLWKRRSDFHPIYSAPNPSRVRPECKVCYAEYQRVLARNRRRAMPLEERRKAGNVPGQRYSLLLNITKKHGIACDISRDEYFELISQPCHYCGFPLNPSGVGLDRKVAGGTYRLDNVVPACLDCNMKKHTLFTYDEMLVIGRPFAGSNWLDGSGQPDGFANTYYEYEAYTLPCFDLKASIRLDGLSGN